MTKSEKIARAIKYTAFAKKNPADAKDVNFYLNAGEKVTQQHLDDYHAAAAGIAVAEPESAIVDHVAEREAEPWLAEQSTVSEPATEPEAEVRTLPLSISTAQRRLVESQVRLRTAIDRQRECRGRLGIAIQKWQQAIGAIISPDENLRQHLASEAQQRADRAAGRIPARAGRARPGPSVIDQIAAGTAGAVYGNRGGAFAYKRPLIRSPAGSPHAMSLALSQATLNRMAAARKLPSER